MLPSTTAMVNMSLHNFSVGTLSVYDGKKAKAEGSWLCSANSPYREVVAKACQLNPGLRNFEQLNRNIEMYMNVKYARIVALDIEKDMPVERTDFGSPEHLRQHFQSGEQKSTNGGTIYLVEGLAPEYIDVFGTELSVEPIFFANHERTSVWTLGHNRTTDTLGLPSTLDPAHSFHLKYHEVLRLVDEKVDSFECCCAITGRQMTITRFGHGYLPEAVIRRKCSFWSKSRKRGGWDALILCDPSLKIVSAQAGYPAWIKFPSTEPWQGGYVDFIGQKHRLQSSAGPGRKSMLDDLLFYFTDQGAILGNTRDANIAAIFPKKIVAAQYLVLLDFARALIRQYEFTLCRQNSLEKFAPGVVESQWSDLHELLRQYSFFCEDIESILLSLKIPLEAPNTQDVQDWRDCTTDFQYIYMQLKQYTLRADYLINSMTGLASIVGNQQALKQSRRSLREAKNVKTLTVIGMIFIPLAYTSSLLSMNDAFMPGNGHFWVYFVIAFPLITFVFSLAIFIDSGYNDNAEWSFKRFLRQKLEQLSS